MFSGLPSVCKGPACSSSPTSGTVYSLVRGDFALTFVRSLWSRLLTGWFAGCGLAAAVACSSVWVSGLVPWLVGAPPAVGGVLRFLFPVLSGWRAYPTPIHGFEVRERHDEISLARSGHARSLLIAPGSRCGEFVLPNEVWTVSTPFSLSRAAWGSVHCQAPVHAFLVPVPENGQTEPSRTSFTPR